MQLCHTPAALSAAFDEPNLIASAGLVPAVALADRIGLRGLADEWLTVPGSTGCAGVKVMSLVAGMLAGADSIDDMDLLRHGGMPKVFAGVRAPVDVGDRSCAAFTFGHVRQLDAVASRALIGLAERGARAAGRRATGWCMLDIDDTVKPVFGAAKQGAAARIHPGQGPERAAGHDQHRAGGPGDRGRPAAPRGGGVRAWGGAPGPRRDRHHPPGWGDRADPGPRRLARTTSTGSSPRSPRPGRGSRSGPARTPRCVGRSPASTTTRGCASSTRRPCWTRRPGSWCRARRSPRCPTWRSPHTAPRSPGRLIVRRVPERNTSKLADAAQQGLFEVWRYHAIFTNNPAPLIAAESQHRGHAIVEQVIADLKAGPLAHLPSGRFQANAAWLVAATIAFNLTRAIGVAAGGKFTKAEGATVRARIINTPARVSRSGRRQRLHLPQRWPWATHWQTLWTAVMTT